MKKCLVCEHENEDDATVCSECGRAAFRENLLTPPPSSPPMLRERFLIAAGVFVAVSGLAFLVARLRVPEKEERSGLILMICIGCGLLAAVNAFLTARPPRLERKALVPLVGMLLAIALCAIVAAVGMAIMDLEIPKHH